MFKGSWQAYDNSFPETLSNMTIVDIGSPKTDALLNSAFDKVGFLKNLDLNPDKKTVLYSPSYQKEASLEQAGLEIIQELCTLNVNVNLIQFSRESEERYIE